MRCGGRSCPATRRTTRHIAKRSSELNAKWMPALGLAAGALWLSVCLVTTNAAEPGGTVARRRGQAAGRGACRHCSWQSRPRKRAGRRGRSGATEVFAVSPGPDPGPGAPRADARRKRSAGKNPDLVEHQFASPPAERQTHEPAPMAQPADPFAERLMPLALRHCGALPPTAQRRCRRPSCRHP